MECIQNSIRKSHKYLGFVTINRKYVERPLSLTLNDDLENNTQI